MRGRLINQFICELAQIDTAATEDIAGYDPVFRDVVRNVDGTSRRIEKDTILLHCQVEVESYEELAQRRAGNDTTSLLRLVFHFQELEKLGMIDSVSGEATIRVNDRLVSIRRNSDNSVIQTMNPQDGYYATEVQPQSFGLYGGERNLLIVTFKTRNATTSMPGGA